MKVFSKTPLGRRSRTLVRMVALPRPGLLCEYSRTLYRFPSSSKVTPLRKSLTSITAFRSFLGDASHYNAPCNAPVPRRTKCFGAAKTSASPPTLSPRRRCPRDEGSVRRGGGDTQGGGGGRRPPPPRAPSPPPPPQPPPRPPPPPARRG